MRAALEGQTGVLLVMDGTRDLALYFERGSVTAIGQRDDASATRLGGLLTRTRAIDASQLVEGLTISRELGCPLGDALMSRGYLDRGQLLRTLAGQVRQRLVQAAQTSAHQISFHRGVACPLKAVPVGVNVPVTLLRARSLDLASQTIAHIVRSEAVFGDHWLQRTASASLIDNHLQRLTEQQQLLWETAFGGPTPLADVHLASTMDRPATHGFVFALVELGFLEACAPAVYDERVKRLEGELDKRLAHNERAESAFDLLDLHWNAVPLEIEASVKRLERSLLVPSSMSLPPAVAGKLARVRAALEDASRKVATETSRKAIRTRLAEPAQLTFAARHAMNQGKTARFRGDMRAALIEFSRAAELDPTLPGVIEEVEALRKRYR